MGWAKRWLKTLLGGKKDARVPRDTASYSGGQERRDKKRRSFDRSRQASIADGDLSPTIAPEQTRLQKTCYTDNSEDNKHAIAVAVATAAAAESAVIAARAAMTRLKCLTHGRTVTMLWAAIKIQKAYRGYLARKALRALKALVNLQALIRGQIVRKQAAATLKQLEALVRVQALSLHRRSHGFQGEGSRRMHPDYFPRRSFEKASVCEARIKYSVSTQCQGSDRSTKIIEVDTCQPQSRSFHATNSHMLHQHGELKPISSPHTYHLKLRNVRCSQDFDRQANSVKDRYSKTTHNTPRLPPASPAESPRARDDILEHLLNRADCPSYMASTRSFAAKVRSYSTDKGRPETPRLKNRLAGGRKMVETPASLVGNARGRNLKVGAEGRLDMSLDVCSQAARDYYLDTMW